MTPAFDLDLIVDQSAIPRLANKAGQTCLVYDRSIGETYMEQIALACRSYKPTIVLLHYLWALTKQNLTSSQHFDNPNLTEKLEEARQLIIQAEDIGVFEEQLRDQKTKWRAVVALGETEQSFEQWKDSLK